MRPRHHHRVALILAAAATALLPSIAHADSPLADVLGVTHIDGQYYFGNQDFLDQGADEVLATGSKVVKLQMDTSSKSKYQWNTTWPNYSSLAALAQTAPFQSVFSKPFDTYVITAYSTSIPGAANTDEYWLNGVTPTQAAAEQKQFYDLAKSLMTTYNGTGKTFVLEQWEGDWALRDGPDRTNGLHNGTPTQAEANGMIAWINAREAGILQARNELAGKTDVKVLGALEVNRVVDAMNNTELTVTNNVLPYTDVDLASYSSYDTQENKTGSTSFASAVNYIAAHLPSTAIYGQSTKSVGIGEFGLAEDSAGATRVDNLINNVVNTATADGSPYAIYWEMYSNEVKDTTATPPPVNGNNAAVRGFYFIRPDGTPATAFHQYRQRLITSDPQRATASAVRTSLHNTYDPVLNLSGAPTTNLGTGWSTSTYGGDISITSANGKVTLQVAKNASAYPWGTATLNLKTVLGRGLLPGEYLQFDLKRLNDTGYIGVEAFGLHHASASTSANSPLEVYSDNAWTPFSFAADGTNPTYDFDQTNTLAMRLDSADGTFATISYYLNNAYAGSWLYPTTATSLDSFSFFAQSNVLGAGFEFSNLQIFTNGNNLAVVPEPTGLAALLLVAPLALRRRRSRFPR